MFVLKMKFKVNGYIQMYLSQWFKTTGLGIKNNYYSTIISTFGLDHNYNMILI